MVHGNGFVNGAYLLTFCPPGPELLLKLRSQIDFGIVSALNWESHLLASAISSSVLPGVPVEKANNRGRIVDDLEHIFQALAGRTPRFIMVRRVCCGEDGVVVRERATSSGNATSFGAEHNHAFFNPEF